MSAVSVGNRLGKSPAFFIIAEFTLGKGLSSVVNVGSLLARTLTLHSIKKVVIAEKSLLTAGSVGESFLEVPASLSIREFTLEQSLMSAVNAGMLFRTVLAFIDIRRFILDKCIVSVMNAGNPINM